MSGAMSPPAAAARQHRGSPQYHPHTVLPFTDRRDRLQATMTGGSYGRSRRWTPAPGAPPSTDGRVESRQAMASVNRWAIASATR